MFLSPSQCKSWRIVRLLQLQTIFHAYSVDCNMPGALPVPRLPSVACGCSILASKHGQVLKLPQNAVPDTPPRHIPNTALWENCPCHQQYANHRPLAVSDATPAAPTNPHPLPLDPRQRTYFLAENMEL